jgi:hypothetical protein
MLCTTLSQGSGGVASVIRECRNCGVQVLVMMGTLALVESGELAPWCWSCLLREGIRARLHDCQLHELAAYGLLADMTEWIAGLNSVLDARAVATHEPNDQENEADNGKDDPDHVGDGGQRVGEQAVQRDEHDPDHEHDQGVDPRHS